MLQRLPVLRSVLVFPYMCRTMPHVELNTSNDTSIGNQEAPVSKKTVYRGISSGSKAALLKHLGLSTRQQRRPYASAMATNNITSSSLSGTNDQPSVTTMTRQARTSSSEMLVSCSEQPQHPPVGDVDRENTCSLPSVSSGCDGSGEGSVKESNNSHDVECSSILEELSLPKSFGKRREQPQSKRPKSIEHSLKDGGSTSNKYSKNMSCVPAEFFDICQPQVDEFVFLRQSQDFFDEAKEPEMDKLDEEPRERVLRPGMVLLKSYISDSEQVSIVRKCRELGIGPGGFYQPAYKYGAKLRLHMMCLGLDWDPQTRKYQKTRRIDKSKPPRIPFEFLELVDRAMLDSLALIRKDSDVSEAEDILPQMNPDICIVNFYSETGRLGLHQDRDESAESLNKGLPVVSFSLGDSAEFLYGDQRDPSKAETLILESGDVLIFGGQSRHVFHGVASIIPDSAPCFLLEETKLIPGRLNLTFRRY
ncbi:uncharacterized protein LOC110730765 isoform X2 [Chenopodium quinoa]|uniref:DNA N(6)-methyladenine demethylase n=1 Tax=Chenopodium quinoa TaxID=63459 RepID=A0A803L393_CHEQI|nr:uncharacterized protein LOC110730765 isoform X2 [Chenopodium quinoa]